MTHRLAVALLALALGGCGAVQGVKSHLPPREPATGPEDRAYVALREGASRRARLYDGFVHRADLNGTWLSPEVRQAGARRLAAWQGWSPAELEAALQADRIEAEKGEQFLLGLYTAEPKHNDLASQASIWHILLDDGTTQAAAATVERMDIDANLRQLFPYIGAFDTVYRVRVPWTGAPLAGRPFSLQVRGALGPLVLDFGPNGRRAEKAIQAP
jgi:hypothetical protein